MIPHAWQNLIDLTEQMGYRAASRLMFGPSYGWITWVCTHMHYLGSDRMYMHGAYAVRCHVGMIQIFFIGKSLLLCGCILGLLAHLLPMSR